MFNFMIAITQLGSPQTMFLLTLFIIVFLWHHQKKQHMCQFGIFISLAAISVYLLKMILKIPRPLNGLILEYGYGFPSGHTTVATLFFLLVFFAYKSHIRSSVLKILFATACLSMIGLISYSRIFLGVHAWADVIGGYALGTFWFVVSILYYDWINSKHKNFGINTTSTNSTDSAKPIDL